MTDPFEAAAQAASNRPILRETSVQQAVNFLNDPRVKGADQDKAISFLRGKGISDDELHEAYRRCGIPFPSEPHLQSKSLPFPHPVPPPYPPHMMQPVPYHRPAPNRPSWVSVFLGITAAAGIYTAIREVLRRYVVPLYFPDAARIAEERRRRDELTLQSQELQIAELRERIHELVETSKKTSEKVDSLTHSVSTSIAQRELEISQNSELRDAIRDLSHSVTASAGTDISVVGSQSRDTRRNSMMSTGFSPFVNGDKSQKRGSLAYSYSENFNSSMMPHDDESRPTSMNAPEVHVTEAREALPSTTRSSNTEEHTPVHPSGGENGAQHGDDDEFMALKPAQVEEGWGEGLLQSTTQNSRKEVDDQKITHDSKREDEVRVNGVDQVDAITIGTDLGEEKGDELQSDSNILTTANANAARELLQNDLLNEAKLVLGKSTDRRARPLSMPQMDVPLSDGED